MKMYEYEKAARFSEDDLIYAVNYLPTLNVSVFKSENIKPLSGRMNLWKL